MDVGGDIYCHGLRQIFTYMFSTVNSPSLLEDPEIVDHDGRQNFPYFGENIM